MQSYFFIMFNPLKILAFLVLGVIALSLAAPVPVINEIYSGETSALTRRNHHAAKQFHRIVGQIKQRLNHFKPGEVVFHSGTKPDPKTNKNIPVKKHAVAVGKQTGGHILTHLLFKNKIWIPPKSPYAKKMFEVASATIAQNARGPTIAVVGNLREKNVYETIEKPLLMKNPNVPLLTEHNVITGKKVVVK